MDIGQQTKGMLSFEKKSNITKQTDEVINSRYNKYNENDIDKLYDSFVDAETGHLEGIKKFIRTEDSKTPGGSSAYGPAQITGTLVRDMLERGVVPKHLENYANRFLDQSGLFLIYGNEKDREGYNPKYDYGGEGDLTSAEDQENYKELAKSILAHHWKNAQAKQRLPWEDPLNTIIHAWRFGPSSEKGEANDQDYWDRFKESFYTK